MTREEKAKAYDEALKKVKNLENTTTEEEALIKYIFPKLAESEDERIRKEIIKFIQDFCNPCDPDCDKWIAYLEKQKESLHVHETCKENADSFTDDIIEVRSFQRGLEEGRRQEQEKQKEQKPEVNDPFDDEQFRRGYEAGKHDAMREQKPAEWSEEDEEILNTIIADVSRTLNSCGIGTDEWNIRSKAIRFLKSLRPSWKPSEEQMIALDGCLEHWSGNKSQKEILESLYEQLKTLM